MDSLSWLIILLTALLISLLLWFALSSCLAHPIAHLSHSLWDTILAGAQAVEYAPSGRMRRAPREVFGEEWELERRGRRS
ncbi:hypothetical protein DACRYDRAFT_112323 [Dacryopinax primogenitus]|uniref:Uncharacterized protein n=1 Tax=Dacryopinax primogenitus (strain DJM 731) TaxID=1858805 RepID=M5FPD5_DACPD|nr:uncharacterized protein DACRYDRAFT_112323 [Dacryopinax primogenitus]EJT96993.1 hypothetical protein DACRYDRAFT_112323 [Dacryopinax primogenitus]